MNDEKLDKELSKLASQSRPKDGWQSGDAFKAEFWRKAKEQDAGKSGWRRAVFAFAAVVSLCLVALGLLGIKAPHSQQPASAALPSAHAPQPKPHDELKIKEAIRLFGSSSGVAYFNDELLVFERPEPLKAERVLSLNIIPGKAIELAVGQSDYIELDTPQLKGDILITKSSGGEQVVCYKLKSAGRSYESAIAFNNGAARQNGSIVAEWRAL